MSNEKIIQSLREVYHQEPWHQQRMSDSEIDRYHQTLIDNGAIQIASTNDELVGYIEVWRLSFEQLGRYICTRTICASEEDVYSGNIAFLANVWIRPDMRLSWVAKNLKLKFMSKYSDCRYFFADRRKRPNSPFQIYDRLHIISKVEVGI